MTTMNASSLLELQILKLININEQEINEANNRLKILTEEKQTLEKFLEIYHRRTVSSSKISENTLTPQMFQGKTIRESLHLIAKNNDQLIVAKDATRLLKKANMFGNPVNASSVVYSALKNPEFTKVGAGVFRLSEHKRIGKQNKSHKMIRKPSLPGLKESIKLVKNQNSNITMMEAKDLLIKQGFDFKGRNPSK